MIEKESNEAFPCLSDCHENRVMYNSLNISEVGNDTENDTGNNDKFREIAISFSLYSNILITLLKLYSYIQTSSLSVLAALIDSILDVVSQLILAYTEHQSNQIKRSSDQFPAGASRMEPIGVLICSALMGMASFEVIKESITELLYPERNLIDIENMSGFWQMSSIVLVKLFLVFFCQKVSRSQGNGVKDSTMEALIQDHINDALSNAIAAFALVAALSRDSLWFIDPVGAIIISVYIMYSWYNTAKEQILQLSGRAAPSEFTHEIRKFAQEIHPNLEVDVCRAYHFGPKFLVELEVVLPQDTVLKESHDLGMRLQYEIESREEVERCFVHIDYEARPYDEHVVSKVPELRNRFFRHS